MNEIHSRRIKIEDHPGYVRFLDLYLYVSTLINETPRNFCKRYESMPGTQVPSRSPQTRVGRQGRCFLDVSPTLFPRPEGPSVGTHRTQKTRVWQTYPTDEELIPKEGDRESRVTGVVFRPYFGNEERVTRWYRSTTTPRESGDGETGFEVIRRETETSSTKTVVLPGKF